MIVRARLVCSDDGCTERFEAIGRIEELEALACLCGAGLEVAAWPAEEPPGAPIDGFEILPLAA